MSAQFKDNHESLLEGIRIPSLSPGPHREELREKLFHGGLAGRQDGRRRVSSLAACIAFVLAGSAALLLFVRLPNALADTLDALNHATSMVCEATVEREGMEPFQQVLLWKFPDTLRINYAVNGPNGGETWWAQGGRTTILNAQNRTAVSLVNMPHIDRPLQDAALQFATPAGLKQLIDRSRAGTEIPGPAGSGTVEIPLKLHEGGEDTEVVLVLDTATRLPKEVRSEVPKRYSFNYRFLWNTRLDETLLVPVLPDGVEAREIDGTSGTFPYPIEAGHGVGPARLGMTTSEVEKALGQPDKILNGIAYQYFASGLEVVTGKQRGVWQIGCFEGQKGVSPFLTFSGTTKEGIGIGSTEQDIVRAYGDPEKRSKLDDIGVVLSYASKGINFELRAAEPGTGGVEPHITLIRIAAPKIISRY